MLMRPITDASFWQDRLALEFGPVDLIRIGENAVWHARDRALAIRMYRHAGTGLHQARREGAAASILTSSGVPAIQLAAPTAVVIDGRAATIWKWVSSDGRAVAPEELGKLLSRAHAAWRSSLGSEQEAWPRLDPVSKLCHRMKNLRCLGEFPALQDRVEMAVQVWSTFTSIAPLQVIHGDAHSGNAISTREGLVLADFDETKVGPIEWDLVSAIVGHQRFGRPRSALEAFASGMRASRKLMDNARRLAPVKEASALTWLAVRALEDPRAHDELRRRLGVHGESKCAVWQAL